MLHKNIKKLLVGSALVALSSSPLFAKTYQHSLGTVEINEVPQRVVVLGFGSLDYLDALGVTPVGMPKSLLPENLQQYNTDEFTNTGSLQEVNYETLFTLKPDLIIAEGRMAKIYKDLKDIAPVYMYRIDSTNYWETTQQHWNNLSEIFGKQAKGEELVADVQAQIDALNAKNTEEPKKALTVMSNGSNITSFSPVSRFSFVYQEAGFETSKSVNVAAESRTHGDLISFEYIADAKPDVMLILDRDQAIGRSSGKAKQLFSNELVESTPAAKNEHMIYLDPAAWYLSAGGYHSTQVMIKDLNRAIQ
ncbi:siderophore ABC transporter substrate-binding protein [Vibrio maerlii]|uniref:siderophore ABC transporter substrate-binding protein n=1 Tax=Vibrio maerlii TaxID=2231648 RepID=UPI000E3C8FC5|nr:ABC transporter substrate-binding protein [Vibrio maerlii]